MREVQTKYGTFRCQCGCGQTFAAEYKTRQPIYANKKHRDYALARRKRLSRKGHDEPVYQRNPPPGLEGGVRGSEEGGRGLSPLPLRSKSIRDQIVKEVAAGRVPGLKLTAKGRAELKSYR